MVPVIHRGLRDRSGDVKKRAARIVGNLCALINDPKDMAPYVGLLLPELQASPAERGRVASPAEAGKGCELCGWFQMLLGGAGAACVLAPLGRTAGKRSVLAGERGRT